MNESSFGAMGVFTLKGNEGKRCVVCLLSIKWKMDECAVRERKREINMTGPQLRKNI